MITFHWNPQEWYNKKNNHINLYNEEYSSDCDFEQNDDFESNAIRRNESVDVDNIYNLIIYFN